MSSSTSIRRLSTASKDQEDLINAYEAEEERLLNVLSRKLEQASLSFLSHTGTSSPCLQLREEKINLENVLEAESESHVNRLTRELTALRLAQQNGPASEPGGASLGTVPNLNPDTELVLDFLRRENEQLRSRLVGIERDYARVTRLNEIYREELIEHRNRVRPFFLLLLALLKLSSRRESLLTISLVYTGTHHDPLQLQAWPYPVLHLEYTDQSPATLRLLHLHSNHHLHFPCLPYLQPPCIRRIMQHRSRRH